MKKQKGVFTGKIEQDDKGNYFCGPYLLDYQAVNAGKFAIGDLVNLKSVIANPSNGTAAQYPQKSREFFLANDKPHPSDKK